MDQILPLIEIYYEIKDGEFIENHQSFFVVHEDEIELRISYRAIKHIVEKRSKDGFDSIQIKKLFDLAIDLLVNLNYKVLDDLENNSYLLVQKDFNVENSGLIIALDKKLESEAVYIKTLFSKAYSKIKKLENKKPTICEFKVSGRTERPSIAV
jgi:hypothetical protein